MKRTVNRSLTALVTVMVILAFAGTVTGAGAIAAGQREITASCAGQGGSMMNAPGGPGAVVESRLTLPDSGNCYFPIGNLPLYYVCVMGCKLSGGGDACPAYCENRLSVCT